MFHHRLKALTVQTQDHSNLHVFRKIPFSNVEIPQNIDSNIGSLLLGGIDAEPLGSSEKLF